MQVGNDEIHAVAIENRQRFLAIPGGEHAVTALGQHDLEHAAHLFLVVDDQDLLAAHGGPVSLARNANLEKRAGVLAFGGLDRTAMSLDDLLHDRESKSYAAFPFEEERIEYVRALVRRDAGAVVGDVNRQCIAAIVCPELDASTRVEAPAAHSS